MLLFSVPLALKDTQIMSWGYMASWHECQRLTVSLLLNVPTITSHAEASFLSLLVCLPSLLCLFPFFFFFPSVFLSLCTPWLPKRYAKSLHWALNNLWKRNGNILALCVVLCNHCSATRHCFIHISASGTSRKKPEPSNFK